MFKKLTLSILASLILLLSFAPFSVINAAPNPPPPKSAATPAPTNTWYNSNFKDWYAKVYDSNNQNEIFGERYTAAQVQWVIYGIWAFIFNIVIPQNVTNCIFSTSVDLKACGEEIKTMLGQTPQTNSSVAATEQKSLFSMVFATDRPLSGIAYFKEKAENFSLVPVAHAQTLGFGFTALQPIQNMWAASRDIAFGLFVIVAIVFAFMIMFRVKISPQVVITVQTAIPKIITALILVTFSYAIAGFLVDLMYVVIGLVSLMLSSFVPKGIFASAIKPSVIFSLLTQGPHLAANLNFGPLAVVGLMLIYISPLILIFIVLTLVVGLASAGLLFWIPLIILLILLVVVLWMAIKIIWALFKAFANIILLTIFAPLQIVAGAIIPNFGFGQWIRSYVSNLSVFVVTGVLFFLSILFLIQGAVIGTTGLGGIGQGITGAALNPIFGVAIVGAASTFQPSAQWPPLLGSGNNQGVGLLLLGVSFVLFTLIPKATEIIQSLMSGKPFAYGTALGEALGPISGPAKFVGGTAQGLAVRTGAGYGAEALGNVQLTGAQQQGSLARAISQLQETLRSMQQKG